MDEIGVKLLGLLSVLTTQTATILEAVSSTMKNYSRSHYRSPRPVLFQYDKMTEKSPSVAALHTNTGMSMMATSDLAYQT